MAGFYLAYQPIPQKDTVHCKISKIFIFYFYRQFRKMNTIPLVKTTMEKLFCQPCELCLLEVLDLSKEVGLCRANGCKVTSCQSWRFEKNSAAWPPMHHMSAPGFHSWTMGSSRKFGGPQLCSPLIYRKSQYLFKKD